MRVLDETLLALQLSDLVDDRPTERTKPVIVSWNRESKNRKQRAFVDTETTDLSQIPESVVITLTDSLCIQEVLDIATHAFGLHGTEGRVKSLMLHSGDEYLADSLTRWEVISNALFEHEDARFTCTMELQGDGQIPWAYWSNGPPAVSPDYAIERLPTLTYGE